MAEPAGTEVIVRFVNVEKSYDGETSVIKDLNFEVAKGEFLTLLGPSGSGKTTCLMMLAGFEPVTGGEIYLAGRPIKHVPPYKRGIGMVFQNYALFPHLTVAENLAFPLRVRRMEKAEVRKRVERALAMVRLQGYERRRPSQLSGGQQQRIAVARALVFDPLLILMDEPLGALDKQLREQMQYEIKNIHKILGITVVYVTHDQSEALTMSDRIAVFSAGSIKQLATPDNLYEQPENAFVASFIGENNTLVGTVLNIGPGTCTVDINGVGVVHAKAVNIRGVGAKTTISLRPERITIGPVAGSLPNIATATVQELTYLGDHVRVRLNVLGTDQFIVKVPNVGRHIGLRSGEIVMIGWGIEDCRALDFDGR